MVYTYVLYSHKDGRWYTGVTKDLRARMREHRGGRVLSTKSRRPLTLVYYEASLDEDDAWRRERYLKTARGKRYLRQRLRVAMTTTWQSSWNGPEPDAGRDRARQTLRTAHGRERRGRAGRTRRDRWAPRSQRRGQDHDVLHDGGTGAARCRGGAPGWGAPDGDAGARAGPARHRVSGARSLGLSRAHCCIKHTHDRD